MIESLQISNFRGFERLELRGLRRINIIVGENSSGKTAFLESVFLAGGGSPEIALRLQAQRGLGQPFQITLDRTSYESLWKYLFHGFDQKEVISIQLVGSPANTRSVTVAYSEQDSLTLPLGKAGLDSPFIVPVTFEWKDSSGDVYRAQPKITGQGLTIAGTGETMPIFLFSSAVSLNAGEIASRFSELDTQGKSGAVVAGLKEIFPYLEGASIQVISGVPTLHATLSYSDLKVPLGLLSGGINKLVGILLTLASRPQGVVLIDEIENGFYYQLVPSIWSALLSSCKKHNTQIFASTHSEECLRALLKSIGENEEEFALIRTERKNGRCAARVLGGRQLHSAIEQNIEVR
jgi:hypothetical protein